MLRNVHWFLILVFNCELDCISLYLEGIPQEYFCNMRPCNASQWPAAEGHKMYAVFRSTYLRKMAECYGL